LTIVPVEDINQPSHKSTPQKAINQRLPMTKRDIVIRISNETNMVQQEVLDVVQRTLDCISEAVAQGRTVELRNFGVFEVKIRKARVGRNPNAPERDVPIPSRAVVKFKPGKEMREAVLKLTPAAAAAPASEPPPANTGNKV
jgi:nucleoid DNA-binding protein